MSEAVELFKKIKLFVLDLDGTVYLDDQMIDGSMDFIDRVRSTGRSYLFFTNNSSKTTIQYIERLNGMGLAIQRQDIMTSGDVTIRYLKTKHLGQTVYLMGTQALRKDFEAQGIRLVENTQPDVVVAAFDTELTYLKLERACSYIRNGAAFLATHLDINCPTKTGFIPDCGALCAAISLSTGRQPKYCGKPFIETVEMIEDATGFGRSDIAFVGDRLYTDVATGVNNGSAGILVLSGETKPEAIDLSEIKPDLVFENLKTMAQYL